MHAAHVLLYVLLKVRFAEILWIFNLSLYVHRKITETQK